MCVWGGWVYGPKGGLTKIENTDWTDAEFCCAGPMLDYNSGLTQMVCIQRPHIHTRCDIHRKDQRVKGAMCV